MQIQKLQYPRKKQYINDLNALLEQYENQSIVYPKSARFNYSKNQNRPKTMNFQRFNLVDVRATSFKPINIGGSGKFLHGRSMSQCIGSPQIARDQNFKTSQQIRKQKMVNMLSTQNLRKQLMNTRKMSAFQYRTRQIKNKQKANQINLLRTDVYRNKSLPNKVVNHKPQNQINNKNTIQKSSEQNQSNLLDQFNKFEMELNLNKSKIKSQQNKKENPSTQAQKKQFLKKGTSINKSILNSLVKIKLTKNQYHNNQFEYQTQNQILKMIKVYKGVDTKGLNTEQKLKIQKKQIKKKSNKQQIFIEGWENQTEQFDINNNNSQLQIPPHAQSNQL